MPRHRPLCRDRGGVQAKPGPHGRRSECEAPILPARRRKREVIDARRSSGRHRRRHPGQGSPVGRRLGSGQRRSRLPHRRGRRLRGRGPRPCRAGLRGSRAGPDHRRLRLHGHARARRHPHAPVLGTDEQGHVGRGRQPAALQHLALRVPTDPTARRGGYPRRLRGGARRAGALGRHHRLRSRPAERGLARPPRRLGPAGLHRPDVPVGALADPERPQRRVRVGRGGGPARPGAGARRDRGRAKAPERAPVRHALPGAGRYLHGGAAAGRLRRGGAARPALPHARGAIAVGVPRDHPPQRDDADRVARRPRRAHRADHRGSRDLPGRPPLDPLAQPGLGHAPLGRARRHGRPLPDGLRPPRHRAPPFRALPPGGRQHGHRHRRLPAQHARRDAPGLVPRPGRRRESPRHPRGGRVPRRHGGGRQGARARRYRPSRAGLQGRLRPRRLRASRHAAVPRSRAVADLLGRRPRGPAGLRRRPRDRARRPRPDDDYAAAAAALEEAQGRALAQIRQLDWAGRGPDAIAPPTFPGL